MYNESIGYVALLIFGIPLTLVALVALFSAMFLLLPEPIVEARKNFQLHPWRSLAIGALNVLGVAAILVLLKSIVPSIYWDWQPYVIVVMAVLGLLVAIPTLIGLSGLVMIISERIGLTKKPFFTYLRGGGLLFLACLTPVVGWFVFLPLVLFGSLGSVVSLLSHPKKVEPEQPPSLETENN